MKFFLSILAFALVFTTPSFAQYAPTPRAAPRAPVNRVTLATQHHASAPASRDIQGTATIIDGEKIHLGDTDVRLFGIVPPQLSASFGPQARAALDSVVAGQPVACHIRDRDHDSRLLATCHATNGNDLALELLRRGLAVTARGSLSDTEYAQPYIAAEQSAQNDKLGLWSVAVPPAASLTAKSATETSAKPVETPAPVEVKKEEPKAAPAAAPTPVPAPIPVIIHATTVPVAHDVLPAVSQPAAEAAGFFARYQILIAGCLMLTTVLGILASFAFQRRYERLDEMKALAAALRGELLAARAVCLTRLKAIHSEEDDRNTSWPRLRSTLYQAYVGRLGWLGAELARQIASIYGQSSDYASYYHNADSDTPATLTPKKQALQNLVRYIDEVLPRLTVIEETGHRLAANIQPAPASTSFASTAVAAPTSQQRLTHTITESVVVSTTDNAAAAEGEHATGALWDSLRRFTQNRRNAPTPRPPQDEMLADYTALIEQDIANLELHDESDSYQFGAASTRKTGIG